MKKSASEMTARQLGLMFIFFFLGNCIVVYLAHRLFPYNIVLGTFFHTVLVALVSSMAVLTALDTGAALVIRRLVKPEISEVVRTALFILVNVAGVWLVARLAFWLGMGITSWAVAVLLGTVLGLVQRALIKTIIDKI